jgi:DNA-binding IclR family transcriptional regulator
MSFAEDNSSTAVQRALNILESVAQRNGGLSNADISRKLKIPKSTASYLLHTLEQSGYLRREEDSGKYQLGLKVLNLSRGALSGMDVREIAGPILRHVVDASRLTAHLAILDRGEAVYIERVEAPGFIKMDTWVGRRMDVHTTSVGKALVAYIPEEELQAILKERGMRRRTVHTITTPAKFLRDLEKVRELGYAIDDEENSLGVRCVAAPVFDASGRAQASVGLTGTVTQVDRASIAKYADLAKEAARRISQQLGYQLAMAKRA